MIVCFGISVSSFIAGVSLKCLVKEANDEIKRLEDRMKRNLDRDCGEEQRF